MSRESLLSEHVSGLYMYPQMGNTDREFVIQEFCGHLWTAEP